MKFSFVSFRQKIYILCGFPIYFPLDLSKTNVENYITFYYRHNFETDALLSQTLKNTEI